MNYSFEQHDTSSAKHIFSFSSVCSGEYSLPQIFIMSFNIVTKKIMTAYAFLSIIRIMEFITILSNLSFFFHVLFEFLASSMSILAFAPLKL